MDVVKELLAHGASINRADKADHTPLHRAAYFGKLNVVKELIAQGANVNSKSDASDTALQLASWGGHWNIVQELMTHGLSIHSPNKWGNTPLHLASKSDNVDRVKENDPSVKTTKKTRKHIVASANDQLEVLQLLLDAG
ncbi:unnamed protein product, partial [Aphanomyces euteiches]